MILHRSPLPAPRSPLNAQRFLSPLSALRSPLPALCSTIFASRPFTQSPPLPLATPLAFLLLSSYFYSRRSGIFATLRLFTFVPAEAGSSLRFYFLLLSFYFCLLSFTFVFCLLSFNHGVSSSLRCLLHSNINVLSDTRDA